jgi:hypothetical protein
MHHAQPVIHDFLTSESDNPELYHIPVYDPHTIYQTDIPPIQDIYLDESTSSEDQIDRMFPVPGGHILGRASTHLPSSSPSSVSPREPQNRTLTLRQAEANGPFPPYSPETARSMNEANGIFDDRGYMDAPLVELDDATAREQGMRELRSAIAQADPGEMNFLDTLISDDFENNVQMFEEAAQVAGGSLTMPQQLTLSTISGDFVEMRQVGEEDSQYTEDAEELNTVISPSSMTRINNIRNNIRFSNYFNRPRDQE